MKIQWSLLWCLVVLATFGVVRYVYADDSQAMMNGEKAECVTYYTYPAVTVCVSSTSICRIEGHTMTCESRSPLE